MQPIRLGRDGHVCFNFPQAVGAVRPLGLYIEIEHRGHRVLLGWNENQRLLAVIVDSLYLVNDTACFEVLEHGQDFLPHRFASTIGHVDCLDLDIQGLRGELFIVT